MSKPIQIFISYADKDHSFLKSLETHLASLKRQNLIETWSKADITAGEERKREIDTHFDRAQVFLLLISPDFMASDYCYSNEMRRAMERHERGEARVIPVILRITSRWQTAPFGK